MHRTKFNSAMAKRDNTGFPQASTYLDFIQRQRGAKKDQVERRELFETHDEKMMRIHDIIWQIADTTVPILITGEKGAGKSYISKCIYDAGSMKGRPYHIIDCNEIAAAAIESELFGFEAGAFPGATESKKGLIELAENGIIVVKEITKLDTNTQSKLLKVIQDQKFERVGGTESISTNTRVIATTEEDLVSLVSKGLFRQDLYYRLYVIHLEVPPVRERQKDIELLANHFLSQFRAQFEKPTIKFSDKALEKILTHSWPGNIAELKNVIQKATILAEKEEIQPDDIPIKAKKSNNNLDWVSALPIGQSLRTVETQFILQTLKEHQGNRTHAARTLGISLRTLRNKINEFSAEGYEVTAPQNGRAAS